jgi:hypothetical protein
MNNNQKARIEKMNKKVVDFINNIPQEKINMKDINGYTFLYSAVEDADAAAIEALCKRGADPTNIISVRWLKPEQSSLLSYIKERHDEEFLDTQGSISRVEYDQLIAAANICKPPSTPPSSPPKTSWWGRGGVKKRNRTFRKKSRKGTRRR